MRLPGFWYITGFLAMLDHSTNFELTPGGHKTTANVAVLLITDVRILQNPKTLRRSWNCMKEQEGTKHPPVGCLLVLVMYYVKSLQKATGESRKLAPYTRPSKQNLGFAFQATKKQVSKKMPKRPFSTTKKKKPNTNTPGLFHPKKHSGHSQPTLVLRHVRHVATLPRPEGRRLHDDPGPVASVRATATEAFWPLDPSFGGTKPPRKRVLSTCFSIKTRFKLVMPILQSN